MFFLPMSKGATESSSGKRSFGRRDENKYLQRFFIAENGMGYLKRPTYEK